MPWTDLSSSYRWTGQTIGVAAHHRGRSMHLLVKSTASSEAVYDLHKVRVRVTCAVFR